NFKLIDDKITFRIFKAEAGHWNARIDVICWSNIESYVPTDSDFLSSIQLGDCPLQHTTASVSPPSVLNDSNVSLTITGTDLHLGSSVELQPVGGGTAIVGTNLTLNPGNTELTADFATANSAYGQYNVVTFQGGS